MGKHRLNRNYPIEYKRTKIVRKKVTPRPCFGCKLTFFSIDGNSKCPQCLSQEEKYKREDQLINPTWHSELVESLKGNRKPVKVKSREETYRSDSVNYRPYDNQDWRKKQEFSGC